MVCLKNSLKKYNIVEYYLFESFVCFIMFDNKGKAYGFFIYPQADVQDVLGDINPITNWPSVFKQNPKIMCYHKLIDPMFPQDEEKKKYIQPAKLFEGSFNTYYWAITDQNLDIEKDKIFSFNELQNSLRNRFY